MFGTLQGRLPQELRLAGITGMEAANRFLAEVFLPAHNQRFTEKPEEEDSAFTAWSGHDPADILCVQEERVVGNDNTVRHERRVLQIPADRHRHHYVKCKVRVHEYPDGTLAVFHGPRRLARYRQDASLIAEPPPPPPWPRERLGERPQPPSPASCSEPSRTLARR